MDGRGSVFATMGTVRFERQHGGKEPRGRSRIERPVAGTQRGGPNELAVRDDLQVTTRFCRQFIAIRVHHLSEKFPARLQVDLAFHRSIRLRAEPWHQMLRRGPRLEYKLRR